LQQISLFSHLQFIGSFRHVGQIKAPQPTHVLLTLLQAQWIHVSVFKFKLIIVRYGIKFLRMFWNLWNLNYLLFNWASWGGQWFPFRFENIIYYTNWYLEDNCVCVIVRM